MLSYIIKVKQYEEYINNRLEILNESTFLFLLYLSLCFTEVVQVDALLKKKLGWLFISIIAANLLINFGIIFTIIGKQFYWFIKRILALRRSRKN